MAEENIVKPTEKEEQSTEEFFKNFMSENDKNQSVAIAKQQDKINALEQKIAKLRDVRKNEKQAVQICEVFVKNNAFPFLNPVAKAVSNQMIQSAKNNKKKIRKAKKQIRKANKKIVKLRMKQQRGKMLAAFVNLLKTSDNKQTAYVNGIQSLQQDSLLRADAKIDKINNQLTSLTAQLKNGSITEVDRVKADKKISTLKSQKQKLDDKIQNLKELGQSLNQFAVLPLSAEKAEKIAQSAINTAEQSVTENKSLFKIIDNLTNEAAVNIDAVINPEKEPSLSEDKPQNQQMQLNVDDLAKKKDLSQAQVSKLVQDGIPLQVTKDNGKYSVIFEKSMAERVNNVLTRMQVKKFDIKSVLKPLENEKIKAKLNNRINEEIMYLKDITQETADEIKKAGYELKNGQLEYVVPENIVGKTMTAWQTAEIATAGIEIKGGHNTSVGQYTIYINKSDEPKVDKILAETKAQSSAQNQTAKPKR